MVSLDVQGVDYMEEHDDEEKVRHAAPYIMAAIVISVVVVLRWEYIYPMIVDACSYLFLFLLAT